MANPLKILTVLTASEAAQFKKAVQVETGGLTVSAGDTVVQNITASNLSASGNAQFGGNVTVAGDITLRDANLRDARLSGNAYLANAYLTGAFLSGDAYLANAYLTGATLQTASVGVVYAPVAYFSGSSLNVDGVAFNTITSSIKTLITNEASARIAGDIAVAATASANLNTVSGALKTYIDAQDVADAIAWAAADAALSGTLKTYVDARDSAISGAFKSYVDVADGVLDARITSVSGAIVTYVDARDTAVSGALKSYADGLDSAQTSARNSLSSSMKSYVDSQDTALSGAVSSSLAAEAAARVAEDLTFLKLDGSRAMTAALNMGSQNITSAKSGSFSGDVTVGGNLQVNGQLTYINSVNLEVTDKLVTIAKGAANGAAADGAGIEVDGAGVSFKYDNAAGKWVSDIGLSVANEASFGGAMKLSGSTFAYIATPVASGKYDVNDAIRALDVAVSGAVNAGSSDLNTLKSNYDALRQVVTGTLSSGTALLTLAGAQFAAGQIDNLALDVMIDADSTGYTNDLVAIKMFVDGANVKVQIDAPAAASAKYRLIVVNEADGKL
jgi:hypothetical protein